MGKEEDSLLMFLSMEKLQDLEGGGREKPKQVTVERSVEEDGEEQGVVASHPVFWICVATMLLALSVVSGLFQFCSPALLRSDLWTGNVWNVTEQLVAVRHLYVVPLRQGGDEVLDGYITESRFNLISPLYEYQGEAIVHDGRAYLTARHSADERGVVARPHSVGRLLHSQVLRMKHRGPKPGEQTVASFQVTFVFSIENSLAGREATGDGFAFVMLPEGNAMGSGGESLGVIDLDKGAAHHTFAVEFDTWKNPSLHDISNNHVGINVNSMVSVLAKDAGYWSTNGNERHAHEFRPLDLTSGKIQAWIDYDGMSGELTVRISPILGEKPHKPLLRTSLDLSKVFNEHMSVGFSAATGDFAAKHIIHSWQFSESGTLKYWDSANNVHPEEASVLPSAYSDVKKSGLFQADGLPRDHVSNLPVFRNPHRHRSDDNTMRVVGAAMVLPTSKELEIRPLMNGMRMNCDGYLSDFPRMDFATFKEHFVMNSIVVFLAFASALVFVHLLFVAYHTLVGCHDSCFDLGVETPRMEYRQAVHQSEAASDEMSYILVVSESQLERQPHSENRPLDRV